MPHKNIFVPFVSDDLKDPQVQPYSKTIRPLSLLPLYINLSRFTHSSLTVYREQVVDEAHSSGLASKSECLSLNSGLRREKYVLCTSSSFDVFSMYT